MKENTVHATVAGTACPGPQRGADKAEQSRRVSQREYRQFLEGLVEEYSISEVALAGLMAFLK